MILLSELCDPQVYEQLDKDIQFNLSRLHFVLNFIRVLYDKPMVVNSGFRSKERHFQIYQKKNNDRISKGLEPMPIPVKSWHLYGAAADIHDPFQMLQKWCLDHLHILEELNVYCESFNATPSWTHFQIYPPKSGRRIFNP